MRKSDQEIGRNSRTLDKRAALEEHHACGMASVFQSAVDADGEGD